jgi:hypothetical protein
MAKIIVVLYDDPVDGYQPKGRIAFLSIIELTMVLSDSPNRLT